MKNDKTKSIDMVAESGPERSVTEEEVKEKETDKILDIGDKNCFNPKISSIPKDKTKCSQQTVKKDVGKKEECKEVQFKCKLCDYKLKKEATLKKHMITKHQDHVCKECQKKLPSFMDLLKHVSTHHVKEPSEEVEVKGLVDKDFKNENMGEK